jgi:hypothetical protein
MAIMSFRIPDDLEAIMRAEAERLGLSLTELALKALRGELGAKATEDDDQISLGF